MESPVVDHADMFRRRSNSANQITSRHAKDSHANQFAQSQFADVRVNHARSLQTLADVRNLSGSINDRINSVTNMMENQGNGIQKHLSMMRETTARYRDLERKLQIVAQLMNDDYSERRNSVSSVPNTQSVNFLSPRSANSSRCHSRSSSFLSFTPIIEEEGADEEALESDTGDNYTTHRGSTASLHSDQASHFRAWSYDDAARVRSDRNRNHQSNNRHKGYIPNGNNWGDSNSDRDSGVSVGQKSLTPSLGWLEHALHSRAVTRTGRLNATQHRAQGRRNDIPDRRAQDHRNDILDRYIDKQHERRNPHARNNIQSSTPNKPNGVPPLWKSTPRRSSPNKKSPLSISPPDLALTPPSDEDNSKDTSGGLDTARSNGNTSDVTDSCWSSVSNTRGARPIPIQSFETDDDIDEESIFDDDSPAVSRRKSVISNEDDDAPRWVSLGSIPSEQYEKIRHSSADLYRNVRGPRNGFDYSRNDDGMFKWSSLPDLPKQYEQYGSLERGLQGRTPKSKKPTKKSKYGDKNTSSSRQSVIIDDNSKQTIVLEKERPKSKKKNKRLKLKLFSKKKSKPSGVIISSPTEAYPIARHVTSRHDEDSLYQIELHRPSNGPYGFYIQRGFHQYKQGIFVGKLADSNARKFLAGMLQEGDEIVRINNHLLKPLSMKDIFNLMETADHLLLTILPFSRRGCPK